MFHYRHRAHEARCLDRDRPCRKDPGEAELHIGYEPEFLLRGQDRAEMPDKSLLLLTAQHLIPRHKTMTVLERGLDARQRSGVEIVAQVDDDFRTERRAGEYQMRFPLNLSYAPIVG